MLRQSMWILMVLITSIASGEMLAQTTNDDQSKITERDCVEQSRKLGPDEQRSFFRECMGPDEQRSFFRECMTNVTPRKYRTAPRQRQVVPQPRIP